MGIQPSVVAIISAFNEEDIIRPVVASLIEDGISVYLLDDGSTDGTVAALTPFLGHGLLGVERLAGGGLDFSLRRIISRKQELAATLQFDWFINHDADEFRESPWPGVSLSEGIARVDALGYDAIDFEVLDFVPTHEDYRGGDDPRVSFPFYLPSSPVNKLQIRCWRKPAGPLDLVSSAGHEAVFEGRRVFPVRFLLRHYPFRGQAHAERKLDRERRPRYSELERSDGWHVQYDQIAKGHRFVRPPGELLRFDPDQVRLGLQVNNRIAEDAVAARNQLRTQVEELEKRLTDTEGERDALRAHTEMLGATIRRERLERDTARAHVDRLQGHVDELGATIRRERLERDREIGARDRELQAVFSSWSWRLTRPLRRAAGWVARARGRRDEGARQGG